MAFITKSIFDALAKDFIGSETLANQINSFYEGRNSTSFPPYNVIETDIGFSIEIAVAGFRKSDITITNEDYKLTVTGANRELPSNDKYIYRGIASREFERVFLIRENIIVKGATFEDGILTVTLEKLVPTKPKPQQILIK